MEYIFNWFDKTLDIEIVRMVGGFAIIYFGGKTFMEVVPRIVAYLLQIFFGIIFQIFEIISYWVCIIPYQFFEVVTYSFLNIRRTRVKYLYLLLQETNDESLQNAISSTLSRRRDTKALKALDKEVMKYIDHYYDPSCLSYSHCDESGKPSASIDLFLNKNRLNLLIGDLRKKLNFLRFWISNT